MFPCFYEFVYPIKSPLASTTSLARAVKRVQGFMYYVCAWYVPKYLHHGGWGTVWTVDVFYSHPTGHRTIFVEPGPGSKNPKIVNLIITRKVWFSPWPPLQAHYCLVQLLLGIMDLTSGTTGPWSPLIRTLGLFCFCCSENHFKSFLSFGRVFVPNWRIIPTIFMDFFPILLFQKPYLGSCEVPHKYLARSVQPFWRLLDTNGQTNKVYI